MCAGGLGSFGSACPPNPEIATEPGVALENTGWTSLSPLTHEVGTVEVSAKRSPYSVPTILCAFHGRRILSSSDHFTQLLGIGVGQESLGRCARHKAAFLPRGREAELVGIQPPLRTNVPDGAVVSKMVWPWEGASRAGGGEEDTCSPPSPHSKVIRGSDFCCLVCSSSPEEGP